ncbi:MAG: hypothetical protein ACI9XO_002813 [Paraglaciecola sp.]|jgi:hypothetical protein
MANLLFYFALFPFNKRSLRVKNDFAKIIFYPQDHTRAAADSAQCFAIYFQ